MRADLRIEVERIDRSSDGVELGLDAMQFVHATDPRHAVGIHGTPCLPNGCIDGAPGQRRMGHSGRIRRHVMGRVSGCCPHPADGGSASASYAGTHRRRQTEANRGKEA